MTTKRSLLRLFGTAFLGLALAGGSAILPASAQEADVVVFAAASLKNALDEASAGWTSATAKTATISYAASSALAKQIESGAPADIFISADRDWMDYLAGKNLIRPESRADILGNRIVLVAPKDSDVRVDIAPGFDLAEALGDGKLAMANTDSVPAGKYGKAALEKLGAWTGVKDNVAQADNVRAALQLVALGEAPLGIVYGTDAAAEPGVKVLGTFPEDAHPPIVYPMALTTDSQSPDAQSFLDYVKSAPAKAAFEKQGFIVLTP